MTLAEKVDGLRLRVIRRAQELGNVNQVCRDAGISRSLFYRWQKRLERYGLDGVSSASAAGPGGPARATGPGDGTADPLQLRSIVGTGSTG